MVIPWGRIVRVGVRLALVLVGVTVLYVGTVFVQVWWASTNDEAEPAEAIVVMGAAQYDGRPSPALERRLLHAIDLWASDYADIIVVTGGRREGDRFSEAQASADFLLSRGVPDRLIRREVNGTNTWESLAATATFLAAEGITDVIIVTDDYHSLRVEAVAEELGMEARPSPIDSGLSLVGQARALVKETAAVSLGRLIGFRRLMRVDHIVDDVRRRTTSVSGG